MERKRRLAELMADEILSEATKRVKPDGSIFGATIGIMLDRELLSACGQRAEERLREEESHG